MGDDKQNRAAVEAWAALRRVVDNNDGIGPPQGCLNLNLMWDVDLACYVAKIDAGEACITVEAPTLDAAVIACTMADGDGDFLKLDHDGRLLCGECEGRDHYLSPCEECRGSGYREPPPGWPEGGLKVPGDRSEAVPQAALERIIANLTEDRDDARRMAKSWSESSALWLGSWERIIGELGELANVVRARPEGSRCATVEELDALLTMQADDPAPTCASCSDTGKTPDGDVCFACFVPDDSGAP